MPRSLRTYLPHTDNRHVLTVREAIKPGAPYTPFRVTQLFGGKRWSLCLIRTQATERQPRSTNDRST